MSLSQAVTHLSSSKVLISQNHAVVTVGTSETSEGISINDYLWDCSDWENEVKEKLPDNSQDGEKLKHLPEELVEKILAMVPFPYVFKARLLSKSWLAKLSPISSHDDEKKARLAFSFQKQIRQYSANWTAFCPVQSPEWKVFLRSDRHISLDYFYGYDRSSLSWKKLPSISRVLEDMLDMLEKGDNFVYPDWTVFMEGALILCRGGDGWYVLNILTGEWNELPPCPIRVEKWYRVIFSHTLETYKVIVVPNETDNSLVIYNSASAVWSARDMGSKFSHMLEQYDEVMRPAYVDGVLWFCVSNFPAYIKVLCINLQQESSLEELIDVADIDLRPWKVASVDAFICNTNLLRVFVDMYDEEPNLLLRIDLGKKQLLGASQGRPNYSSEFDELNPVSDGDYVFTDIIKDDGSRVLAYNIHADEWQLLPCKAPAHDGSSREWEPRRFNPGCSFRPGLNPFAAV